MNSLDIYNFSARRCAVLKSLQGAIIILAVRLKKKAAVAGRDLLRLFDGVETFVMFIGYPRSGHSLIGSLLDAHPEIIVSHEYCLAECYGSEDDLSRNITKYRLFYELYSLSERQALFSLRSPMDTRCEENGGYCYHVPGLWQGTYTNRIKVNLPCSMSIIRKIIAFDYFI